MNGVQSNLPQRPSLQQILPYSMCKVWLITLQYPPKLMLPSAKEELEKADSFSSQRKCHMCSPQTQFQKRNSKWHLCAPIYGTRQIECSNHFQHQENRTKEVSDEALKKVTNVKNKVIRAFREAYKGGIYLKIMFSLL